MGLNRITRVMRAARTVTKATAMDIIYTAVAGTHLFVTECVKAIGTPPDEELSRSDWDGPLDASTEREIESEVKGWLTTPSAGPKPPSDAEMHLEHRGAEIECWDCGGTFFTVSDPVFTRLVTYEDDVEYGHLAITCPGGDCGSRTLSFCESDMQTAVAGGIQIFLEGKKAPNNVRKIYADCHGRAATKDDKFDVQTDIKLKALQRREGKKLTDDATQYLRKVAEEN